MHFYDKNKLLLYSLDIKITTITSEKETVKDLVIYYRLQMSGTPPEM